MKKGLCYILSVFSLIACSKKKAIKEIAPPTCHIERSEFIDIMTEYFLLKSAKSIGRRALKNTGIQPKDYLFRKYSVDSVVIKDNLRFYTSTFESTKEFYEEVKSNIKGQQILIEEIIDEHNERELERDEENERE